MPRTRMSEIDISYTPTTYFWAHDSNITLSSDIKGAERKKLYERLIQNNQHELAEAIIDSPTLTDSERESFGRIHPNFLGGEYLPSKDEGEVEIARITIASTTQDVTSVYARRGKSRIYYRVVDEYGGSTLNESSWTSTKPISLRTLTKNFLNAWDLLSCLDCNFESDGYPRDRVHNFIVDASSSFYAEFGQYIHFLINEWLDEMHQDDDDQSEE